jgi:hypothetical protein
MPHTPPEPIDWRSETYTAVVGTLFLAFAGAVAGLIWHAVSPKLSVAQLAQSSDATFRAHIGSDAWFLLITVLVAILSATVLCVIVRRPGPGAAVALGAGGLLAAFVADRVGYVAERPTSTSALHALGLHPHGGLLQDLVDFKVRATGVMVGWPLASLAVLGIFLGIGALRRS